MSGRFIVIEGPDGSGTTTHSHLLVETLQQKGVDAMWTKEPTDGPIGKEIRMHLKNGGLPSSALQLMFCADRAWHVEHEILPALSAGKTVVSDRYWHSTVVYGEALGLDAAWLTGINEQFLQPETLIFLLPPFSVYRERMGLRDAREILEEESLQERVYAGYRRMAQERSIASIDTSGSIEEGSAKLLGMLTQNDLR